MLEVGDLPTHQRQFKDNRLNAREYKNMSEELKKTAVVPEDIAVFILGYMVILGSVLWISKQ